MFFIQPTGCTNLSTYKPMTTFKSLGISASTLFDRGGTALAKTALGAAVAMGALAAGQANAVVVNVPGYGSWDVTTFTGSYNANESRFNVVEMPWWGNEGLASLFAGAVGFALGAPNGMHATLLSFGPKFSFLRATKHAVTYYSIPLSLPRDLPFCIPA